MTDHRLLAVYMLGSLGCGLAVVGVAMQLHTEIKRYWETRKMQSPGQRLARQRRYRCELVSRGFTPLEADRLAALKVERERREMRRRRLEPLLDMNRKGSPR